MNDTYTVQDSEIKQVEEFERLLDLATIKIHGLNDVLDRINVILSTDNKELSSNCKGCLRWKTFICLWSKIHTELKQKANKWD